jgi:large subunit ribosomal protein L18
MAMRTPKERYAFRKIRTRKNIHGSAEKPRLAVHKSSKHIYAQLIDDASGTTVAFASTLDPELKKAGKTGSSKAAAEAVGKLIAERAKSAKVQAVVFDRGAAQFHGRIKALADSARSGGLQF